MPNKINLKRPQVKITKIKTISNIVDYYGICTETVQKKLQVQLEIIINYSLIRIRLILNATSTVKSVLHYLQCHAINTKQQDLKQGWLNTKQGWLYIFSKAYFDLKRLLVFTLHTSIRSA